MCQFAVGALSVAYKRNPIGLNGLCAFDYCWCDLHD